jgi:hypothetical protein
MSRIQRINKNTLFNISQFSNKLIKIAKYLTESGQFVMLDNSIMISDRQDHISLLDALDKDLDKASNLYYDIQKLLITVDDNGIVNELNNDEKDLSVLFGDKYNAKFNSIEITKDFSLNISKPMEKADIKSMLVTSLLDMNLQSYKHVQKVKTKLKNVDKESINNDNDAINYLVSSRDVNKIKELLEKINKLTDNTIEYRQSLSDEEKDLIDTQIVSERTMIDGVVQDSTYLKNGKIIQSSPKHKAEDIEKLNQLVKDTPCIGSMEIDKDADISKILDVVQKIKKLHINTDKQIDVKIRKLGNYNVNGMFIHGYNIVTVDVNQPSALLHEIVHAIDLTNHNLLYSQQRKDIINKLTQRMYDVCGGEDNFDEYESGMFKAGYLKNPAEVIARSGELAGILNLYGYEGENPEDFFKKIEILEKLKVSTADKKNVLLVKYIAEYDRRNIDFFNFKAMTPKELQEIQSYFSSYFNLKNGVFKPIDEVKIEAGIINLEGKDIRKTEKERNSFKPDDIPFSKVNYENIEDVYLANKKEKVIDPAEFAKLMCKNRFNLGRTTLSISKNAEYSYNAIFKKYVELVVEHGEEVEKKSLINYLSTANHEHQTGRINVVKELQEDMYPSDTKGEWFDYMSIAKDLLRPCEGRRFTHASGSKSFNDRHNEPLLKLLGVQHTAPLKTYSVKKTYIDNVNLLEPEELKLMCTNVEHRLSDLENYDKNDPYLHVSLLEMSDMFKEYTSALENKDLLSQVVEQKKEKFVIENENQFFSDIENVIKIETEKLFKVDVEDDLSSIRYAYRKPKLKLKLKDFNDDFLLQKFDDVIKNISEVSASIEKTKVYQKAINKEELTDKNKLSLMKKISLSNLNTDFSKTFISELNYKDVTNDKLSNLITLSGVSRGKDRAKIDFVNNINEAITDFIQKNNIRNDNYDINELKSILYHTSYDYAQDYHTENNNTNKQLQKGFQSHLAQKERIAAISNEKSNEILLNAKEYNKTLFELNNKIVKFMHKKDVLNDYVTFFAKDREFGNWATKKGHVELGQADVKSLLAVHGTDLRSKNAITELKSLHGIKDTPSKKLKAKKASSSQLGFDF